MTVTSGILDVLTFINYRVFASKQTGNVLFLAVYLFSHKDLRSKIEQNVVVSLIYFCVGNFGFSRFAHRARPTKRTWLLTTTCTQALMIFAAAIVRWASASQDITSASALAVVGLLAFAASGQTSLAATVGLPEVNTTMVTGALILVLNDPKILNAENPMRSRRLFFIAFYALGCIIGAVTSLGPVKTLFLVSAMKMVISASFLLNRGRPTARFAEVMRSEEGGINLASPLVKASWGD